MIYGEEAKSLNPEMFFESMKNGERKISVGIGEDEEKSAVLGVPFSMKMADGRECIALVGRLPIEYISSTLSLGDGDTMVYSFVIRKDGSFVIRSYDSTRDKDVYKRQGQMYLQKARLSLKARARPMPMA